MTFAIQVFEPKHNQKEPLQTLRLLNVFMSIPSQRPQSPFRASSILMLRRPKENSEMPKECLVQEGQASNLRGIPFFRTGPFFGLQLRTAQLSI